VRWRRDERQQPDDRPDLPAEEWLSQFRPVRPEALTAADRDARPSDSAVSASQADQRRAAGADWGAGQPDAGNPGRGPGRAGHDDATTAHQPGGDTWARLAARSAPPASPGAERPGASSSGAELSGTDPRTSAARPDRRDAPRPDTWRTGELRRPLRGGRDGREAAPQPLRPAAGDWKK